MKNIINKDANNHLIFEDEYQSSIESDPLAFDPLALVTLVDPLWFEVNK